MKRLALILIGVVASLQGIAQQNAMFTHYAFNTLAMNPGYAGSRDALTVTMLNRTQWVGFDGAPVTQTVTMHSPIIMEPLGIGLSVLRDRIGPTNTTNVTADIAYKIKVHDGGKLSFGLKGGLGFFRGDLSQEGMEDDPAVYNIASAKPSPTFGFGMYYSTLKWYAGVSSPDLFEKSISFKNADQTVQNIYESQRHYFAIAGAVFNLNSLGTFKMKPTSFVKITQGAGIVADFTSVFIIRDVFELGAMLRTGDAWGALAGFNINNQLRLGYSFDWSVTNPTFKYNGGSHEVMLRYDFIFQEDRKVRSPRYF